MKISAEALFLAGAVFLCSIKLISSIEPPKMTLAQLFPGYEQDGQLPPIKVFTNTDSLRHPHFQKIGDHVMFHPEGAFLARGHVIFAWTGNDTKDRRGDYLQPLFELFLWIEHEERWVFDTIHKHWVSLNRNELMKLGIGYRFKLVKAQQDTAGRHRLTTGRPDVDARAHNYAYEVANRGVDSLQASEANKIRTDQTTIDASIAFITRRYEQEYNIAFGEYTQQRGRHFGYSSSGPN